jgi:hypothetical protein
MATARATKALVSQKKRASPPDSACVPSPRVVELNELGICGRLQPNLLKSRRRELGRFPLIPVARSFA